MRNIHNIPSHPQRQDSIAEQLADLVTVANRLGMRDAANMVQKMGQNMPVLQYGCHCDLEPHMNPDGCVIDQGRPQDCIYEKRGMRKEQCRYWRRYALHKAKISRC